MNEGRVAGGPRTPSTLNRSQRRSPYYQPWTRTPPQIRSLMQSRCRLQMGSAVDLDVRLPHHQIFFSQSRLLLPGKVRQPPKQRKRRHLVEAVALRVQVVRVARDLLLAATMSCRTQFSTLSTHHLRRPRAWQQCLLSCHGQGPEEESTFSTMRHLSLGKRTWHL